MDIQENESEIIIKIQKKHDYDILLYNPDFFNLFGLQVNIEVEIGNSNGMTGGGFFTNKVIEREQIMDKKEMMKLSIPYRYFVYLLQGSVFDFGIIRRFNNLIQPKPKVEVDPKPEPEVEKKEEEIKKEESDGFFSSFKFFNKTKPTEQEQTQPTQDQLQQSVSPQEQIQPTQDQLQQSVSPQEETNIIQEKIQEQEKGKMNIDEYIPEKGEPETKFIPDFKQENIQPETKIETEIKEIVEEKTQEQPQDKVVEDKPIVNAIQTIVLKIKKKDPTMSIVNLDSYLKSLESSDLPKSVEQLSNNGLSYFILERIVKDLYIQFRFNKIHGIYMNDFSTENIYCINKHYLILSNENLEQVNETDYIEKEKELCKSFVKFIDSLIGVDKDLIHSIIGNTEVDKFKNRMEKDEKMLL